jgi:transposase-like protein
LKPEFDIRESLTFRWKKAFREESAKTSPAKNLAKEKALCASYKGISRELRKERDILKSA